MINSKNLISGTSGGLGKYLQEEIGGDIYNRKNKDEHSANEYETIIHCAFKRPTIDKDEYYIREQVNITKELACIKHERFIFMSSIDIYSKRLNEYGRAKLKIEQMLQDKGKNKLLIIRPPMLIGKYMKANTAIRIVKEKNPTLRLTKDSTINMVFYEDIKEICMNYKAIDINLMNTKNLKLEEIAKIIKNSPNWGAYKYETIEPRSLKIKLTEKMNKTNQLERLIKEAKSIQLN